MPQNKLQEAELNNLCSHYKDSYEIHLASVKQREMLFYALLVILALFSLQVTSTELVNDNMSSLLNKQLDISIDKHSSLFETLLSLLLFGFSSRYYQTVIQIERQYNYLHNLEDIINRNYAGTLAFTREGKSYLNEYPIFSKWIGLLYTLAFPLIVLLCIKIRIDSDISKYQTLKTLSPSMILGIVPCLLVGISTILYLYNRHNSLLRELPTILSNKLHEILRILRIR